MRVLVVSSDASERARASSGLMARDGVDVDEANSAAEAHQRTAATRYDVLVIDGDMRPEGGQSMLYELRARAEYEGGHAPPAIVLMAREQDRWLSTWAGAHDAALKPVDPFDLAARVMALAGEVDEHSAGRTAGEPLAQDAEPPEIQRADAPVSDPQPSPGREDPGVAHGA